MAVRVGDDHRAGYGACCGPGDAILPGSDRPPTPIAGEPAARHHSRHNPTADAEMRRNR
jgi:hypothetical protein